jgi:predicted nucleic acid-binding protein
VAHYLDTSALVKLVIAEPHSDALRTWLRKKVSVPVSSDLARTELMRAVRRTAPESAGQARVVLDSITLINITTDICEHAGYLDPTILRSLDAVHLAAALSLGDDLAAIVSYDDRLAQAARTHGVPVAAPE